MNDFSPTEPNGLDEDRDVREFVGEPEETPSWMRQIPQGFAGIVLGQRPLMGGPPADAADPRALRRTLLLTILALLGVPTALLAPGPPWLRLLILGCVLGGAAGLESALEARAGGQVNRALEASRRRLLERRRGRPE